MKQLVAVFALGAAAACAKPWMRDESERMEEVTAAADEPAPGVVLGADAPALAAPFPAPPRTGSGGTSNRPRRSTKRQSSPTLLQSVAL